MSKRPHLLIADDDETVRNLLEHHAEKRGFNTFAVGTGIDFMDEAPRGYDIAILDLRMPDGDGFECLQFLKKKLPELPAVVLSSADEVEDVVRAMKAGAVDYLTKPFDLEQVFHTLRQAMKMAALERENLELKASISPPRPPSGVEGIVGGSGPMEELISQIGRISEIDSTVLLTGESGVGKGLIARTLHYSGVRADHPFVTVSCPALPRELLESELFGHEKGAFTGAHQKRVGKIEMAKGGTLFLDEIGDLPLDLQPKLLNVLQDREFQRVGGSATIATDVRVIAATNVEIEDQIGRGEFREDLYYRLNVIPLEVPSLRERPGDIKPLVESTLERLAGARGMDGGLKIEAEAMACLERYDWPGNVRQLENLLERAAAFCQSGVIGVQDLPKECSGAGDEDGDPRLSKLSLGGIALKELEKAALLQTLDLCGGNKAESARRLGITEKSVYNKLKRFGLG